jgi:hypothetical protein
MFKVGDRVVCIDNDDVDLEIGKIYNVYMIKSYSSDYLTSYIIFLKSMMDNNDYSGYSEVRFISLQEYRRLKLDNLKRVELMWIHLKQMRKEKLYNIYKQEK